MSFLQPKKAPDKEPPRKIAICDYSDSDDDLAPDLAMENDVFEIENPDPDSPHSQPIPESSPGPSDPDPKPQDPQPQEYSDEVSLKWTDANIRDFRNWVIINVFCLFE